MKGEKHLTRYGIESDTQELPLRTRVHNFLRKIALVEPTEEEWKRMRARYLEANTVWVEGTDIGFTIESLDMDYRVEPDDPTLSTSIKANMAEEAANNELREIRKAAILQKVYGNSHPATRILSPDGITRVGKAKDEAQKARYTYTIHDPEKSSETAIVCKKCGCVVEHDCPNANNSVA